MAASDRLQGTAFVVRVRSDARGLLTDSILGHLLVMVRLQIDPKVSVVPKYADNTTVISGGTARFSRTMSFPCGSGTSSDLASA